MPNGAVLILRGHEIEALLNGREQELIASVGLAYETHALGQSALPHSTFLHFGVDTRNRIIALPAYLGGRFDVAGVKWIASFPGNLERGLDRASGVLILNSPATGHPATILEGSFVSAKRTAASAALAARSLCVDGEPRVLGCIGCGVINLEIARFLFAQWETIDTVHLYDVDERRGARFAERVLDLRPHLAVARERDATAVLAAAPLVSIATTALEVHLSDLSRCPKRAVILHISLRDLTPQAVLGCDNVVDDVEHVCRARTSLDLAATLSGDRRFIRCTLGEILLGRASARSADERVAAFSPFGLGVLDVAVGQLARQWAAEGGRGTWIDAFLPEARL